MKKSLFDRIERYIKRRSHFLAAVGCLIMLLDVTYMCIAWPTEMRDGVYQVINENFQHKERRIQDLERQLKLSQFRADVHVRMLHQLREEYGITIYPTYNYTIF